jgi:hypothetical protein
MFEKTEKDYPAYRWIVDIILVVTVLPIIAGVVYMIYIAYKTYHPVKRDNTAKPEDLNLPSQSVKIPGSNNRDFLDAWLILHPDSRQIVIISHEYRSQKDSKLKYANFLYQAGYNVLLFDHRNHGSSSQNRSITSIYKSFALDLEFVISYVRSHPLLTGNKIALLSFSLSTIAALEIMLKDGCQIHSFIFDSGPTTDMPNLTRRYLNTFSIFFVPALFSGPIIYLILREVYVLIANSIYIPKWSVEIRPVFAKMLFIANEEDQIVPVNEVKKIADYYPESLLWIAKESRHLMAYRDYKSEYQTKIIEFLNRC